MLAAVPVFAHKPYGHLQKDLRSPQGERLVLEKVFGDGLFGPDPSSLQLRNRHGAVIAYTPANIFVGVFCPSLDACWAFPHDSILGLGAPYRLEPGSLDYEKPLDPGAMDKAADKSAPWLENPYNRKEPLGFRRDRSILMRLATPFFTLLDHGYFLGLLALSIILPPAARLLERRLASPERVYVGRLLSAARALIVALCAVVLFFVSIFALFQLTPWLYALGVAGAARWFARRRLVIP